MEESTLYLKTTENKSTDIIKKGHFDKVKLYNIENYMGSVNQFNIVKKDNDYLKQCKQPGSLGWGLYAFANEKNAKLFQGCKEGKVLKFNINYDNKKLLDLWKSEETIFALDKFACKEKVKDNIKKYKNYCKNKGIKLKFQRSDRGLIIEYFIKILKKDYDIVRMLAQNNLNGNNELELYNSVEYCIRNDSIIVNDTIDYA